MIFHRKFACTASGSSLGERNGAKTGLRCATAHNGADHRQKRDVPIAANIVSNKFVSIPSKHVEILIIGAGLAGLSAASTLVSQGREVLVLDKGRGVGGRLAGRQIDGANFDHGAQFMTARNPRFIAQVERWVATGVATEWYRSHSGQPTSHARWRGVPNMREIAKQLAANIDIILACRVEALYESGGLWCVETDDARTIEAQAVLLLSLIHI